jgi:hypothetical protein
MARWLLALAQAWLAASPCGFVGYSELAALT